jgi:hypothetical protein
MKQWGAPIHAPSDRLSVDRGRRPSPAVHAPGRLWTGTGERGEARRLRRRSTRTDDVMAVALMVLLAASGSAIVWLLFRT